MPTCFCFNSSSIFYFYYFFSFISNLSSHSEWMINYLIVDCHETYTADEFLRWNHSFVRWQIRLNHTFTQICNIVRQPACIKYLRRSYIPKGTCTLITSYNDLHRYLNKILPLPFFILILFYMLTISPIFLNLALKHGSFWATVFSERLQLLFSFRDIHLMNDHFTVSWVKAGCIIWSQCTRFSKELSPTLQLSMWFGQNREYRMTIWACPFQSFSLHSIVQFTCFSRIHEIETHPGCILQ